MAMNQRRIVQSLEREFGIDGSRVMFLNGEPWLPSDVLMTIARRSGKFLSIEEDFKEFVPVVKQFVHTARLVDRGGMVFQRSGVATVGEQLPTGEYADPHDLAASRALVKVMNAAGVNPFKPAAAITFAEDDKQGRNADLARIHILAGEAGLVGVDEEGLKSHKAYYGYLREWGRSALGREVKTSAELNQEQRAMLIESLKRMAVEE